MVSSDGAPAPADTVQVTITMVIPVGHILNPGPLIYGPGDRKNIERLRLASLPDSDGDLLAAVQLLLETKEAVQQQILARVTVGEVRWRVGRP